MDSIVPIIAVLLGFPVYTWIVVRAGSIAYFTTRLEYNERILQLTSNPTGDK